MTEHEELARLWVRYQGGMQTEEADSRCVRVRHDRNITRPCGVLGGI